MDPVWFGWLLTLMNELNHLTGTKKKAQNEEILMANTFSQHSFHSHSTVQLAALWGFRDTSANMAPKQSTDP